MNREQKSAVIDEIAGQIDAAEAVFAVDYRGISVPQAAELRAQLRDVDATFRVVKNSLTERAADKAGAQELRELLEGPTAFTFVRGDAAVAAKTLSDFARRSGLMPFKGGLLEGRPLTPEELQAIARLPARELLHAQLVGTVAAPLTGLVRGLGSLVGGLAVALGRVREKKESGELPAGEPEAAEAADSASATEAAATEGGEEATETGEEAAAEVEAAPAEGAETETAPEAATQDSTDGDGGDAAAEDKE
jgi:large subunit ribosomal protein L10